MNFLNLHKVVFQQVRSVPSVPAPAVYTRVWLRHSGHGWPGVYHLVCPKLGCRVIHKAIASYSAHKYTHRQTFRVYTYTVEWVDQHACSGQSFKLHYPILLIHSIYYLSTQNVCIPKSTRLFEKTTANVVLWRRVSMFYLIELDATFERTVLMNSMSWGSVKIQRLLRKSVDTVSLSLSHTHTHRMHIHTDMWGNLNCCRKRHKHSLFSRFW